MTALGIFGPLFSSSSAIGAVLQKSEFSSDDKNVKFVDQIEVCFPPGVSVAKAKQDLRRWVHEIRYRQALADLKREKRILDYSVQLETSPMLVRIEFPTLADREFLIRRIEENNIFNISKRDALGYSFKESLQRVVI